MQFDRDEAGYPSVADRRERGKQARKVSPRSAAGTWEPLPDRRDPVGIIEEGTKTAIKSLVPIRYGRMSASPFTFYRGTAAIMAADLPTDRGDRDQRPTSGCTVPRIGRWSSTSTTSTRHWSDHGSGT